MNRSKKHPSIDEVWSYSYGCHFCPFVSLNGKCGIMVYWNDIFVHTSLRSWDKIKAGPEHLFIGYGRNTKHGCISEVPPCSNGCHLAHFWAEMAKAPSVMPWSGIMVQEAGMEFKLCGLCYLPVGCGKENIILLHQQCGHIVSWLSFWPAYELKLPRQHYGALGWYSGPHSWTWWSFYRVWKGGWNTPVPGRCHHTHIVVILVVEIMAKAAWWYTEVVLSYIQLWEAQIESKLCLSIFYRVWKGVYETPLHQWCAVILLWLSFWLILGLKWPRQHYVFLGWYYGSHTSVKLRQIQRTIP